MQKTDKSKQHEEMQQIMPLLFKNDVKGLTEVFNNRPYAVSWRDNDNRTALHYAAEYSNSEVVKLLFSYGADALAENNLKQTPAWVAKKCGRSALAVFIRNTGEKLKKQQAAQQKTFRKNIEFLNRLKGLHKTRPH